MITLFIFLHFQTLESIFTYFGEQKKCACFDLTPTLIDSFNMYVMLAAHFVVFYIITKQTRFTSFASSAEIEKLS